MRAAAAAGESLERTVVAVCLRLRVVAGWAWRRCEAAAGFESLDEDGGVMGLEGRPSRRRVVVMAIRERDRERDLERQREREYICLSLFLFLYLVD